MSTSFQNRMSTLVASTAASALSSHTSMTASQSNDPKANAGIVLQGYYRKLKTMKKKYFVLYSDTQDRSARLEYYDSEKKFKTNFGHPKRTIVLRTCFNINRRTDTKHKWVAALYNKDDCFCIVFDAEQDLNSWLRNLLSLQRGDDSTGDPPRPNFEHTWSVQIQRKGLAEDKGIIGNYHLCLTEKSLTLVRVGPATAATGEHRLGSVEFLLTTIRRCGNTQCFFYMEVGRHSAIGAGELWMETQDAFIAENMHQTIISASATCKSREEYMGPVRPRSSSANEASKPISMTMRRQTHIGQKPMNFSPSGESPPANSSTFSTCSSACTVVQAPNFKSAQQDTFSCHDGGSPEKNPLTCSHEEDMNLSQHDVMSSTSNCCATINSTTTPAITRTTYNPQYPSTAPLRPLMAQRRHSVSAAATAASTSCHQRALSLPCAAPLLTNAVPSSSLIIASTTSSSKSGTSSIQPVHQRTRSLPLTEETAIIVPLTRQMVNCSCPTDGAPNSFCSHKIPHGTTPVGIGSVSDGGGGGQLNNNHLPSIGCAGNCPEMNNNRDHQRDFPSTVHHHMHHHHHIATTSMESIVEDQALTSSGGESDDRGSGIKTVTVRKISGSKFPGASTSFSGGSPLLIRRARNTNSTRSSAMKRERCDSLPSRNRAISESSQQNNTSMPPPRSIPSNRPHSMYNRHSNSPPVNSCPLSPSGACSESDGSSLSIDETDGFGQSLTPDEYGHHFQRYMGGMSQESAILEENSDEYWNTDKKIHSMYERSHKYGEKGITQNGTSLSLPIAQSQNQRKGSPAPPVGSVEGRSSYIEMYSPCGSSPGDPTGSSGYLPMSPGVDFGRGVYTGSSGVHSRASSLAEEGVDNSQNEQYVDMSHQHHGMSGMSSAASSSSITSGTPSTDTRFADYPLEKVFARFTPDEEDASLMRDRPIRAYSVGSRMEHNKRKFRIDLLNTDNSSLRTRAFSLGSRAKVPRSEQYKSNHTHSTIVQTNLANNNGSTKGGKKSSSAPMLDKKTNPELMDDFMEIDFSRGDDETPTETEPMAMPSSQLSESCNFTHESYGRTSSDCCDGYVEMKPVAISKSPSLSSSPVKSYMSPRTVPLRSLSKNNNNMDMSPVMARPAPSVSTLATSPKTSTPSDDYLNMSPVDRIHEKMDVDMPRMSSAPEGYIEMSWPKNVKTVNNNTIPEKPASDEYINMSFQGGRIPGTSNSGRKESPKGTQRMTSMPIAIQGKQPLYSGRSSLSGKSESQQSFLPLTGNVTTHPPAHRSESKDSGIVTPTGSNAAIFPFSPSSPMKPFQQPEPRKCLVDGSTGTLMLAEEESSHASSGVATPTTPTPMEGISTDETSIKGLRKCPAEENRYVDSITQQTKIRRLSMEVPDYVNCAPVGVRKITPSVSPLRASSEDVAGDYVLMRPATTVERVPKTVTSVSNNSSQISLNNFEGFIPITSAEEESSREEKVISPRTGNPSSLKRPFWSSKESDASFDSLRVASRPNSVNSDKITSKISSLSLNRPNSANSDHMPPISSSSSASTLCGSSSSSSTLCGSKSPSNATLMRPQSFTESSSRPDSVTDATTSRPPSVTSEKELHYASLDLPQCSAGAPGQPAGLAPLARQEAIDLSSSSASSKNASLSGDSSASPSPNAPMGSTQVPTVAFTYAKIDFSKCENAKATTPN